MEDIQNHLLDNGYLPHAVIRLGIRRQLRERISIIASTSLAAAYESKMRYIDLLRSRPIAIETTKANEQHYEVGTSVLEACLGPRMKYSCCLYPKGGETLGQAEIEMMKLYIERAGLEDGMDILDLGCGWGSFSLFVAQMHPKCNITAFSNSRTQAEHISSRAKALGLTNVTTLTGDVVTQEFNASTYDRVISIELFEHMKNYKLLMQKVSKALRPRGKLFVHIFAHKSSPYDFDGGWMTEHFFTGGTMPSADLLLYFQEDLSCTRQWWVSGKHYARTCEDWLSKMTENKLKMWPGLVETYGAEHAKTWFYRWQVFYMACAELFAWEDGDTWGVTHLLFTKTSESLHS